MFLLIVFFSRGMQLQSEGNPAVNYAGIGIQKANWLEMLDNRALSVFSITNIVNRVMAPI